MPRIDIDWLRLTRLMTQYVVPGLLAVAFLVEISGTRTVPAFDYLAAVVFSFLTLIMIGACGWIVFLWDIDRLFSASSARSIRRQCPMREPRGMEIQRVEFQIPTPPAAQFELDRRWRTSTRVDTNLSGGAGFSTCTPLLHAPSSFA
jgi:hypothetical protein